MSRRIRLLVVTPSLSGGGAERFTSLLLSHLDRSRFEPHLCVMKPEFTYPLPDDVPVVSIDKGKPHHLLRSVGRIRRVVEACRPDLVLSTMLYPGWLVGAALEHVAPRPRWVARFGNLPAREYGWQFPWLSRVFRHYLRGADLLVANSLRLARHLEGFFSLPEGAVRTAYNPVDVDFVRKQAGERPAGVLRGQVPTVIGVGRLTAQKRPDLLVEAFAALRRLRPAKLILCGDGPLRPRVDALVRRYNLTADVEVLGFQVNPYRWLQRADVFVLASDYEGFPNALLEAQALGLPAVSTECPTGPDEIVQDGVTGVLVPVGDADAITRAIERLFADPESCRAMGEAARRRIAGTFDLRSVVGQWEEVLLAGASSSTTAVSAAERALSRARAKDTV